MSSYKRITSAIHNLGDSFLSLTNYIDDGYVIDDLNAIHRDEHDIEIDWLTGSFEPADLITSRIEQSIDLYCAQLDDRLSAEGIELADISSLRLVWPARQRRQMLAIDNRGAKHSIYVREYR